MKSRIVLFTVLVVAWSGGVGARLYDLQVRRHPEFARKAASQQQRVVEIAAPRGAIYDARGRELAVSVEVESLYASPGAVPIDRERTAAALAPILHQSAAEIAKRLDSDREFVWVARKLDPEVSRRVRELALPGIYFLTESRRYYPMRELAAQTLGYVGMDGEGLGGLEARYESVVRGQSAAARAAARRAARIGGAPRAPVRRAGAGTGPPPHARRLAPVHGREGAAPRGRDLARAVGRRHRPRSARLRGADAGFVPDVRPQRVLALPARAPGRTTPSPTSSSPARASRW